MKYLSQLMMRLTILNTSTLAPAQSAPNAPHRNRATNLGDIRLVADEPKRSMVDFLIRYKQKVS